MCELVYIFMNFSFLEMLNLWLFFYMLHQFIFGYKARKEKHKKQNYNMQNQVHVESARRSDKPQWKVVNHEI